MRVDSYKVTVCRLGCATVRAESEEEAEEIAGSLPAEEICWMKPSEQMPPFLVAYVEKISSCDTGKR